MHKGLGIASGYEWKSCCTLHLKTLTSFCTHSEALIQYCCTAEQDLCLLFTLNTMGILSLFFFVSFLLVYCSVCVARYGTVSVSSPHTYLKFDSCHFLPFIHRCEQLGFSLTFTG